MRRRPLLLAGVAVPLLAACGGGEQPPNEASLRVMQATGAFAALDFFVDGERRLTNLTYGTASEYLGVEEGTRETAFAAAGSTTFLQALDRELERRVDYTVVVFGDSDALRTTQLVDDDTRPSKDNARLRVLNAAADAGKLDVYLTGSAENLADATPVAAGLEVGATSKDVEVSAGGWRLRVTTADATSDLRLDIPAFTLGDEQIATLIVTLGNGGVLVNALLLDLNGAVTRLDNPSTRVRAVAAVAGRPVVNVSAGGIVVANGLEAPSFGDYVLVPAGSLPLTVEVAGSAIAAANLQAAAGADITLLVHGASAGAAEALAIADDNRPADASGDAKIRLLHGVADLGSTLTLKIDLRTIAPQVPYPSASPYASIVAVTTSGITVTSPAYATPLSLPANSELKAGKVYTVFVIGGPADFAAALVQDR